MRSQVELRIDAGLQMRKVSEQLKAQGRGDLERKMRRNVRRAAQPVVADLRRAVLGVQVQSEKGGRVRPDRSTGLRARVAGSLTTSVTRRGVRIKANAKRVAPGGYGSSLPKYLDADISGFRSWRHPVFGRRDNPNDWQVQTGQPWFFRTLARHENTFRRAVLGALDDTIRELER
jgi:hypothetical protein